MSIGDETARERLTRIAEYLRETHDGGAGGRFAYLPQSDAEFLTAAFRAFLSKEAKTLDEAFGVKQPGRPKQIPTSENEEIALDVIMRTEWADPPETMAALKADWGLSERRLGQIRDEYRTGAMRRLLDQRLNSRS